MNLTKNLVANVRCDEDAKLRYESRAFDAECARRQTPADLRFRKIIQRCPATTLQ